MGAMKGLLLGLANTAVIAMAIAATEGEPHFAVFVLVMIYGFIPGLLTGAIIGAVADLLKIRPAFRIAILFIPAVGMVALLGNFFELKELILPSCIPTAVSVLLLERSTRPRPSDFPAARTM